MRGPSLFAAAVAVHDLDRPGDARKTYLQQLGISPDSADAHYGLGVLLMQIGHLNEGLSHLHRALEINPANGTHWLGFIRALAVSGRIDEAHQTLTQGRQRGLDGEPVVRIQNFLKAATLGINRVRDLLVDASQLEVKGCSEDALRMYQLAYEIRPHDPAISERIGDLLNALYRSEEAEIAFNRVVNLTPNSELGFIGLGMSLFAQGKVLEAIAAYGSAIALNGSNPTAHALMGAAQDQIGNAKEAEAEYRRALAIKPDDPIANSNLLFMLAYRGEWPADSYLREARSWDVRMLTAAQRQAAQTRTFSRSDVTSRKLRVGYVSGDFRQHAVAVFFEQILANRDHGRSEVWLYSNNISEDAVSERLKAMSVHWIPVSSLSDQALCDLIAHDEIDVLVDLSGHTAHNRLSVFALRAAPVQAHYLGYFASTGLHQMDYLIGDHALIPDQASAHFSETVWRLPRVWLSYSSPDTAPKIKHVPSANGRIRLGSFNHLGKLNDRTLALWAKVLQALPNAQLLLKAKELGEPTNQSRLLMMLGHLGISADRIELMGATLTWHEHMGMYNCLDIALDPISSHSGVTTTCDALWMGVPLVTLAGDRFSQRQSVSILTALGQERWIAQTEKDYIDTVVQLALDEKLRRHVRQTQRAQMKRSTLCDSKGLADSLDDAYFAMFKHWQTNLHHPHTLKPTESFL